MTFELFKRRTLRLSGFDYASAGAYFVTICANGRKCLFGRVINFQMHLNDTGLLVAECWNEIPNNYPFVRLDEWILMPNHVHGIIWIGNDNISSRPLWAIVAAFKARSTSELRKLRGPNVDLWQRSFYEHIIRNDEDLARIRKYVVDNPAQWALDPENPNA